MKIIKALAVSAAMVAYVGTAHADDGAYVNVGVDTFEFDNYGVGGKVGYNFAGGTFGVEIQGSLGLVDEEVTSTVDQGYDYIAGGFVTLSLPIGQRFSLISRTGYYFSEFTASSSTSSASTSIDGFAAGTGVQYMFDDDNGIRLDYTVLDGQGGSANTGSLSFVRRF